MNRTMTAAILGALVFSTSVEATTWVETTVADPIHPHAKCEVSRPASSGSYIYAWPSKYDQVFFPHADLAGIWFCKSSGFTAFVDDFDGLTATEKDAIAIYLKKNYDGRSSLTKELILLEGVYSLRNKDDQFKNSLLRILARFYQEYGYLEQANAYRRKALSGIEHDLSTDIPEAQRLIYFYLAANYHRQFGNVAESDKYLEKLNSALNDLQCKQPSSFAEYLSNLAKETKCITPGGVLDPKVPENGCPP